jgi:hypothetical protein
MLSVDRKHLAANEKRHEDTRQGRMPPPPRGAAWAAGWTGWQTGLLGEREHDCEVASGRTDHAGSDEAGR